MFRQFFVYLFILVSLAAEGQSVPKRIVSLVPSLTRSLYLIDAQEALVGRTSYCVAAEADDVPVVASAVKINLERVLALKPDLVLASGLSSAEDLDGLRRFGIRVLVYKSPRTFDEICEQLIDLGRATGTEANAERVVADCRQKVDEIVARRKGADEVKMFFQIGANPLFAVIPRTFMNDYITLLNGRNIIRAGNRGTVSREHVLAQNPDYLFVALMGAAADDECAVWRRFSNLKAVREGHVFVIDPEIACEPTPVNFVRTLVEMDRYLTSGGV